MVELPERRAKGNHHDDLPTSGMYPERPVTQLEWPGYLLREQEVGQSADHAQTKMMLSRLVKDTSVAFT